VEIPFESTYCEDPTLPAGQEQILVEGQPGQMLCQANVVYHNTKEQQRTVTQESLLEQPITQIVAVGTGENVDGEAQPIFGDGFIVLPTGEVLTYTHTDTYVATAYTMTDDGCDGFTANGNPVRTGAVAIDPSVVPYGTRMFIVTNDGEYIYGLSTAEDCGTGVDGKRVDLYMHSTAECFRFGIRECTIYFLGDANWR
jgi:3D (Asp-Asp-Asp) domain-containing protein